MGSIPLPALAIRPTDPNEMDRAFLAVIQSRQAAQQNAVQQQQLALEQQQASQNGQLFQMKLQQAQQAARDQQLQNQAWQAATKNGAFDDDTFAKSLQANGFSGDIATAVSNFQSVAKAKQLAQQGSQKSGQDYVDAAKSAAAEAAKITDPQLADNTFMNSLKVLGDTKDLAFFGSLSPQQRMAVIKSQAPQPKPTALSAGQILVQPDASGAYKTVAQGPDAVDKAPPTKTLMVNGQPHVMGYDDKTKAYTIDYGLGQPNYGQQILPTKFTTMTGADGLPHKFQWNPQTNSYSIDMGVDANGAFGHSLAQASVIKLAGNGLINDIQANRKKFGNMDAILNSAFLGTPLADPKSQELAAEISSFAALQPALHGFRGSDALREFKKLIGGLPNSPDALIGGINGILKTAGAFSSVAGGGNIQQLPKGAGKTIDRATAMQFYQAAGGDPNKARALAQQNGWKVQ